MACFLTAGVSEAGESLLRGGGLSEGTAGGPVEEGREGPVDCMDCSIGSCQQTSDGCFIQSL
jgi:hypothetical protein